ncbi:hypothetical protein EV702DRAFT_1195217 [Suillus placidus]|uniref:Uncharacterized protein n=1 Tax=Suillus placidus TaxID=48579 RepID=A0A9P6ZYT7_9AGAM|nr:hypothetical protein EV702DRAFT_1195217 [Suillus placidus]
MARIASHPALDIVPDFASPTFEGIRNHIIGNTQATHGEAANELTTGWQQDRDIRLAAWNVQVNKEARLAAEAARVDNPPRIILPFTKHAFEVGTHGSDGLPSSRW